MVSLFKGDCLSVLSRTPSESVDLTVTSPPYDNLRSYNGNIAQWSFAKFKAIAQEIFRVTKDGGVVVWVVGDATVKGSETGTSFRQALWFMECGFRLHDTMIYRKKGTGACGSNYCYWQSFEYMFVFSKGRPKVVNRLTINKPVRNDGRGRRNKAGELKMERKRAKSDKKQIRPNVWEYSVGNANRDDRTSHPAVFPEQLAADHIASWSAPGDLVLDPFLGSGTTGKMAILAGRNFLGIEIDSDYFSISKRRILEAAGEALPCKTTDESQ